MLHYWGGGVVLFLSPWQQKASLLSWVISPHHFCCFLPCRVAQNGHTHCLWIQTPQLACSNSSPFEVSGSKHWHMTEPKMQEEYKTRLKAPASGKIAFKWTSILYKPVWQGQDVTVLSAHYINFPSLSLSSIMLTDASKEWNIYRCSCPS